MQLYSKENPGAVFQSSNRFISCSAKQAQSIDGYQCCNSLDDGKFFILDWPNQLHNHEYEYLYVPTLKQGVCLPDFCSDQEIEDSLDIINQIFVNMQLDFWLTNGQSEFQLPEQPDNSTTNSSAQANTKAESYNIYFEIEDTEKERVFGRFPILFLVAIFIILAPISLYLLTKWKIIQNKQLKSAFNYDQHTVEFFKGKLGKNNLNVFNLVRIYGVIAVFLIHSYQNQDLASNYHQIVQNAHSTNILMVYFFFQAVDIFLFMGGFFQAISWAKKSALETLSGSFKEVFIGIYQRFLRVWPIFFIILIIYNQIYYHLGSGPIWNLQENELENCDSYMWGNMFFIDNLISVFTWKCFGHSWYISVDFQLYSICLIALWFYSKSLMLFGSLLYNLIFSFDNNIRALDISDLAKFEQFTESSTYYIVGMYFYRKPWSRAPLFVSGLLFGISYQNKSYLFSQNLQKKLQETYLKQFYLFAIGLIVIFLIFFPLPLLYDPQYYSNDIQSLYFFLMPILTISLMLLLVTLMISQYNKNEQGLLNRICNHRITSILAKISFIMYLSHIFVIRYFLYTQLELQEWTPSRIFANFIRNFLISTIVCCIFHIYYEVPISKLIAKKRTQKQKDDQVSTKQSNNPSVKRVFLQNDIQNGDSVVKKVNTDKNEELELKNLNSSKDNKNTNNLQEPVQTHESQNDLQPSDFQFKELDNSNYQFTKQKGFKYLFNTFIVITLILFTYVYFQYNDLVNSDENLLKSQHCSFLCKTCDQKGNCLTCLDPFEKYSDGCQYKEQMLGGDGIIDDENNSIQYDLVLFKKSNGKKHNYHGISNFPIDSYDNKFMAIYHKSGIKQQRWLIDFKNKDNFLGSDNKSKDNLLPSSILTKKGGLFSFLQSENYAFYDYEYLKFIDYNEKSSLMIQIMQKFKSVLINKVMITPRELVFYIDTSDLLNQFIEIADIITDKVKELFETDLISVKFLIDTGYNDFLKYPEFVHILNSSKINYFIVLPQINENDLEEMCENGKDIRDIDRLYNYQQQLNLYSKKQKQQIQNIKSKQNQDSIDIVYVHSCAFKENQSFLNEQIAFQQIDADLVRLLSVWNNQSKPLNDKKKIASNLLFLEQNEHSLKERAANLNKICKLKQYKYKINALGEQKTCFSEFLYEYEDYYPEQEDEDQEGNNENQNEQKQKQYYHDIVFGEEQFNENPDTEYHYDEMVETYGAKCLKGDVPSVQYRYGKYKQRWILLFQGAGQLSDWSYDKCGFEEVASQQANSDKGAAYQQKNANVYNIYRSPLLNEYNMLFMYYCDGSLFQGSSEEPYQYQNKDLWFRGENNTIAYIQHAIKYLGLAESRQIVIYGTSSGGTAVTLWANYIWDEVKKINPYVDIRVIADAGMFMDYKAIDTNRYVYREQILSGFYKVANKKTPPPNKECVEYYSKFDETWKCLFVEYNIQFIKPEIPVLLFQSAYDFINIPRVGKVFCVSQNIDCVMSKLGKKSINKFDLDLCNSHQTQYIHQMRDNIVSKINYMKSIRPSLSAWVIGCLTHDILPYSFSDDFQVPQYSGNTSKKVLYNYLTVKDYSFFEVDPQRYPNNYMCAGKSP
ncbi:hypothetical protein PPERSA_06115 [Pseudocohnilembus persalinus]|uniref:Acyltransferase 3 domain-containing protein n=1 Tax=Pseudocohnilembus persalinus TaxID=266149 RepID=A0A0V0QV31_PSEPJ|nr:hypothetical protein PPERSA_06115 [Pseudocohnilembus persalinus]|eukprot:KRX06233.1 hypothetical protein PPERSA_06115 [Pseudocohnilembus persalinus]